MSKYGKNTSAAGVLVLWCVAAIAQWPNASSLRAQEEKATPSPSTPPTVVRPGGERPTPTPGGGPPSGSPSGPPKIGPDGKPIPPDGDKSKEGDKKPDGKSEGSPTNVTRPTEPPEKPNPDELKVRPDAEGKVQFQFRNQPWPDLLRWLADVSDLSLDWQELPGDYLNLATQRPYTLVEARDMINRHLLSRGFTMLEHEGVLSIVKTSAINPALVPRVEVEELSDQPPHRFVRASIELSFLVADEVEEEFKSMLSPNGKITALSATNRLEIMDAAANLSDIARVINDEQSQTALDGLAREFKLEYARAEGVKLQLEAFLGVKSGSSSSSSRGGMDQFQHMQQQMQQQMQQMQQQMQQAQGGSSRSGRPSTPVKQNNEVYIVANVRNNSLIVSAAPQKLAVVAAFIQRIDVPNSSAADFQRMQSRMKVYRLATLDPKQLVASLIEMDALEPTTKLQVDEDNAAIIAYASLSDQFVIQSVIDRLDGSGRQFEVIQLRRLDAESVAGSIQFLMGAQEEKDNSNDRSRYYYGYFGGDSSSSKKKNEDKMRVGANVNDNQIMLWANSVEMEEVRNLLVKLGELPPEGGRPSNVRVIDASRQPETLEYLRKLQERWNRVSPNPLVLPDAKEFEEKKPPEKEPAEKPPVVNPGEDVITFESTRVEQGRLTSTATASSEENDSASAEAASETAAGDEEGNEEEGNDDEAGDEAGAEAGDEAGDEVGVEQFQRVPELGRRRPTRPREPEAAVAGEPKPIEIMVDESGNLVLRSEDTAALDRLEELMQTNKPPKRPYDLFHVKYTRATWIVLNLEDYFKNEESTKEDPRDRYYSWLFGMPSEKKKTPERQLGKKVPLRFLADNDTNTIIVQGANDAERQTIQELIDLWDVAEPINDTNVRYTKIVKIEYSQAESIAEVVKDAYRDYLSANDKAFQQQNQNRSNGSNESKRNAGSEMISSSGGENYSLKGKLSVGVDPVTNSIVVFAQGKTLLDVVCKMIQELDQSAKPQGSIEILQMSPDSNGDAVERALRAIMSKGQSDQNSDSDSRSRSSSRYGSSRYGSSRSSSSRSRDND
ncbi:MAG: secretin N-terminal domain-containing protein [Aureliella sp.]